MTRYGFVAIWFGLSAGLASADEISVDKEKKTITVPCKIAPRKLERYNEIYPIEVVASYPDPKGKKAHETVVTIDVKPRDVHKALVDLGLTPGNPAKGEAVPNGPEVKISLDVGGRTVALEKCLIDKKTGKTLPPLKWLFTGSVDTQPDPNKPDKAYAADLT